MSNKRVIAESNAPADKGQGTASAGLTRRNPVFPPVSDDLRAQLETGPRQARKSVSDGYKFKTSIPSYQGMTIGPTTTSKILSTASFDFGTDYDGKRSITEEELQLDRPPSLASKMHSMGSLPLHLESKVRPTKRGFESDDNDTDTDDDNDYSGHETGNQNNTQVRRIYTSPRKPGVQSFMGQGQVDQTRNLSSTNSIDNDFEEASFLETRESFD